MARSKKVFKPSITINWTAEPSRAVRLLDWLDEHPQERQVLFCGHNRGGNRPKGTLLKKTCTQRAALSIFTNDTSETLRALVQTDLPRLGDMIANFMRKTWKADYHRAVTAIGPAAANLECYEMDEVCLRIAEQKCPHWRRLHGYWRDNVYYNIYYRGAGLDIKHAAVQPGDVNEGRTVQPQNPRPTTGVAYLAEIPEAQPALANNGGPSCPPAQGLAQASDAQTIDSILDAALGAMSFNDNAPRPPISNTNQELWRHQLDINFQQRVIAANILREQLQEDTGYRRTVINKLTDFITQINGAL